MIESFAIKNYRSIGNMINVELVSPNYIDHLTRKSNGLNINRLNFFYGKNGAGKSNIVNAIDILVKIVLNESSVSRYIKSKNEALNFSYISQVDRFMFQDKIDEVTFLSMVFHNERKRFRYSLVINNRHKTIVDECLEVFNKNKFLTIISKSGKNYSHLSIIELERLNSFKLDRRTALDIIVNELNLSSEEAFIYGKAFRFFKNVTCGISKITDPESIRILMDNKNSLKKIINRLREFDLSIEDISVSGKELSLDDFKTKYSQFFGKNDDENQMFYELLKFDYSIDVVRKEKKLKFSDESSGTRTIANFLFSVFASGKKVFILDDYENDLHAEVASELLKYLVANLKDYQFIFVTHDLDILNMEEVHHKNLHYFVERDNSTLSTDVKSLAQFGDLRNDSRNSWESFYKKYRLGQYPKININK